MNMLYHARLTVDTAWAGLSLGRFACLLIGTEPGLGAAFPVWPPEHPETLLFSFLQDTRQIWKQDNDIRTNADGTHRIQLSAFADLRTACPF